MTSRLSDFQTDPGFDPAEDNIGPFFFLKEDDIWRFAFEAEQQHCNANGTVHGGVLMTFADYALCMQATDGYTGESCVTVSFSSEFVSSAEIGSLVECEVELTRKTGSMAFVTGKVLSSGDVIMTFSSVVKRLRQ